MNLATVASQLKTCVSALPDTEQHRALSIAAGYIAAYSVPVFADKDALSAEAVFVRDHQKAIAKGLGDLNKILVIGLSDAIDVAKVVWTTRYRLVHEPTSPDTMAFLGKIIREQGSVGLSDVIELTSPSVVIEAAEILAKACQEVE